MAAFVSASKVRDTKAGRELSGECWTDVDEWFNRNWEFGTKVTTSPVENLSEKRADVGFSLHVLDVTDWNATSWEARLERDGVAERWRVCDFRRRYWDQTPPWPHHS